MFVCQCMCVCMYMYAAIYTVQRRMYISASLYEDDVHGRESQEKHGASVSELACVSLKRRGKKERRG